MANPNFNPTLSSNDVWRDQDPTRCLTDDLDAIETDISALERGKAEATHTHEGYADSDHEHSLEYIAKALQCTNDDGSPKMMVYTSDNTTLTSVLENLNLGFHTLYCQGGVIDNPGGNESCRCVAHKTNSNIMWVLAFATSGSIYSNYLNGGTWRGWRVIYSANPSALWTGGYYMTSAHTIMPSKALSECQTGWLLIWSDYDSNTSTVNDEEFVTTVIYKRRPGGTTWNGQTHYFDIPRHSGASPTDVAGESRIIKQLHVYDNKLVGVDDNQYNPRNDVVLRAVYEF